MIKFSSNGDVAVVSISGELNSSTAIDAENAVNQALANARCLILDFSELTYISSAGLRVVLLGGKMAREKNGKMAIVGAGDRIKRVFQLSGLARHFNNFDTREEADKFVAE